MSDERGSRHPKPPVSKSDPAQSMDLRATADGDEPVADVNEPSSATPAGGRAWNVVRAALRGPDVKFGGNISGGITMKGKVLTIKVGGNKVVFSGHPSEISEFVLAPSRVLGMPRVVAIHRNGAQINIGHAGSVLEGKNPIVWQENLNFLNNSVGRNSV